jgi:DNA-binding Lrp family transcriptional regulator
MAARREEVLADLAENQPTNAARIAERLDLKASQVGVELRALVEDGKAVSNGKGGRGCRFALKGFAFETAASAAAAATPSRRRASKPVVRRRAKPSPITLADVAKKHGASGFLVRIGGMEVECPSAASVFELAAAQRAAS